MPDKLIAGAVAYRERRGLVEWFLVKAADNNNWELPKSDVRRGESSVRAALRHLKEGAGVRALVLEEAGRVNVSSTRQGNSTDEKLIFYLMRQSKGAPEIGIFLEGKWLKLALAKKQLKLTREQKVLSQAADVLKAWQKAKRTKNH